MTPRRSPRTLALGTVNGSLIGIEYGSPQKRDREIWGALVPSNREWMPGADETTTMTTSVEMKVGDVSVPAGDHTFYFTFREDGSRLLISRDVGQFHTAPVIRSMVLGTVEMTLARRTDRLEGLTFTIEPRGDGGVLKMAWDDREYTASLGISKQ